MTEEKKDYICPQCGADPNGSEVHALTHHTLPLYPEREAIEIVELTEAICQKNECIDNRNRTLREQEKLIDELKAWRMVDEQKLIDAGEELAHIRLKPLADAALTFLSGDGEGAEVVSPGTDDDMTRLDVPTPTWEDLCDAVDRYRARNVKVFRLNDYEWYAAETLESATGEALRVTGVSPDEAADEFAGELTEEEMDRLIFYDNMEDQEASETRTFREQLDRLIDAGTEFPVFFAGTEA